MARLPRSWTSELSGSFHIISRVAGGERIFGDEEKEYFLLLLEKLSKGFFVDVHSFCILDNHFHILATERDQQVRKASKRELIRRYQEIFGKESQPPPGSYERDGTVLPDEDDGLERLRSRLGSISRFTQELKQGLSRWYNKRSKRRGYLWAERFKGVIVGKGEAQLVCSAYIDLNPIRAGIVKWPEDYRWSSIGLMSRDPKRARRLLSPLSPERVTGEGGGYSLYRLFVYEAGGIKKDNRAAISEKKVQEVRRLLGRLGLGDQLRYRMRNLTEGHAIGSRELIEQVQGKNRRRHIKPRNLTEGESLFTTRVLKL
ncbi:MAG: hypothetical protein HYU99_06555 [Deltaproteobacteria bacterium]|nr:hypothetical protein [Deltaproteobacteria bacterium]